MENGDRRAMDVPYIVRNGQNISYITYGAHGREENACVHALMIPKRFVLSNFTVNTSVMTCVITESLPDDALF